MNATDAAGAHMLSPFKHALRRVPGVTPGTRSLQRHLLVWLLLPQLVLWLAAAWVTYNVAERYANKAIDASLTTATRAAPRSAASSWSCRRANGCCSTCC